MFERDALKIAHLSSLSDIYAYEWAISNKSVAVQWVKNYNPTEVVFSIQAIHPKPVVDDPINPRARVVYFSYFFFIFFAALGLVQDYHPPQHISFASTHSQSPQIPPERDPVSGIALWPDHCVSFRKREQKPRARARRKTLAFHRSRARKVVKLKPEYVKASSACLVPVDRLRLSKRWADLMINVSLLNFMSSISLAQIPIDSFTTTWSIKGQDLQKEQYSVFDSSTGALDRLLKSYHISHLVCAGQSLPLPKNIELIAYLYTYIQTYLHTNGLA